MFKKIMVPVDLGHADRLGKALSAAAALSKQFGAPVCYVGVSGAAPSSLAHTPEEYAGKLEALGRAEAEKHGHIAQTHAMTSHDPSTDLDATLLKAVHEIGADLVVMATHVPGLADRLWSSNGGYIAARSDVSVMLVRDPG